MNPWRDLCIREFESHVANYFVNKEWRKIHEVFPELVDIFNEISKIHIHVSPQRDMVIWRRLPNGVFSVAYAFNSCNDIVGPRLSWGLVWSSKLIPKINMFLWLMVHDKILTINNLWKTGFSMHNICYLCKMDAKDSSHLFIGCCYAQ